MVEKVLLILLSYPPPLPHDGNFCKLYPTTCVSIGLNSQKLQLFIIQDLLFPQCLVKPFIAMQGSEIDSLCMTLLLSFQKHWGVFLKTECNINTRN